MGLEISWFVTINLCNDIVHCDHYEINLLSSVISLGYKHEKIMFFSIYVLVFPLSHRVPISITTP